MSNLFKSKFLLGVMVVAVLVVGGVVLTTSTASASDCTITQTLRQGMSGADVLCLQSKLEVTPATGYFGTITKAAVMAFQTSNSLVADGIVGALSRAALMVVQTSDTTVFPAGCTSALGFSTTTGLSCATSSTLPAGCTSTVGYSPTTGAKCDSTVVTTLPAGCTSTVGYSSTTGQSCSGTVIPVNSNGEGSISLDYSAIPAASVIINKGVADQDAANIKIKATGSDMKVSRVWLDFSSVSTSGRLWLAASVASLWDGSTVLATIPLSSSTVSEITTGTLWQLQFNGLNVTVPVGTTKVLTFKLSRPELTTNSGTVTIAATSTIRAVDMAGISNVYYLTARVLNLITTAATTGKLTTNINASSPATQSVSGLSATAGVLTPVKLADFDFKGKDAALNITQIKAVLAATSGTIGNEVASAELRDGTSVLSSVALVAGVATFTSLNVDVAKDTTKTLSVWAQMNPIGTPGAGYTTKGAGITATLHGSETVATDSSWATITDASADTAGNTMYMFQYAPILTLGAVSAIQSDGSALGDHQGNYSLSFTITAPTDSNIYFNRSAVGVTAGTYPLAKTAAKGHATWTSGSSITGGTGMGTTLSDWDKITAGTSRIITITANIPDGGTAGFVGVTLNTNGLNWTDTDSASDTIVQTWGLTEFKTPEVQVTT